MRTQVWWQKYWLLWSKKSVCEFKQYNSRTIIWRCDDQIYQYSMYNCIYNMLVKKQKTNKTEIYKWVFVWTDVCCQIESLIKQMFRVIFHSLRFTLRHAIRSQNLDLAYALIEWGNGSNIFPTNKQTIFHNAIAAKYTTNQCKLCKQLVQHYTSIISATSL